MKIGEIIIDESNLKSDVSAIEIVGGIMFINTDTLSKIIITSKCYEYETCGELVSSYAYYIDGNRITEGELKKLISNFLCVSNLEDIINEQYKIWRS